MGAAIREVNFDCHNPRLVAESWSAVLGWDVQENGDVLWMSESGAPFPDLLLVFALVPENKTAPKPVSLADLSDFQSVPPSATIWGQSAEGASS
jgi:hypothetical protein